MHTGFFNGLELSVDLFFLDHDTGVEKRVSRIGSGFSHSEMTYHGHSWVVRKPDGQLITQMKIDDVKIIDCWASAPEKEPLPERHPEGIHLQNGTSIHVHSNHVTKSRFRSFETDTIHTMPKQR